MSVVIATWMAVSTAYCCLGVGGGYCHRTASGAQVTEGQVAAPRSIPFGTLLAVEGYAPPEQPAVVTDRGSDIGEGRIDVFFWQCRDAWRWGRRRTQVQRIAWVDVPAEPDEAPAEDAEVGE